MTTYPDELSLVVNGQQYAGWETVRVTRSAEGFPSHFEIGMAAKSPTGGSMIFQPFEKCQVFLGKDLVITGWIDTLENQIDAATHNILMTGRSLCEDLVDCSAEFLGSGGIDGVPNMAQTNMNVLSLAQKLCQPYGLTVSTQFASNAPSLQNVPVFRINPGETPYELIERFAKFQGVLVYDGTDGNLILATIGYSQMASGFTLGQNIQSIGLSLNFAQRYSEIDVFDQTVYSQADGVGAYNLPAKQPDNGITRHRRLITISEAPYVDQASWKQRRATWEVNRRVGRSQIIRLRTPGWRDSAGTLWTPNSYVIVDAPYIGINKAKWIIGEVTYSKDLQTGTTSDLMIMSPLAYSIEPTVITPLDPALSTLPANLPPQDGVS